MNTDTRRRFDGDDGGHMLVDGICWNAECRRADEHRDAGETWCPRHGWFVGKACDDTRPYTETINEFFAEKGPAGNQRPDGRGAVGR